MARARRWRRWIRPTIPATLEALLLDGIVAGPARAGYQATVDVNESAFQPPCIGFVDSYPSKMLKAAGAAYARMGYATGSFTTTNFTRAHTLARTVNDWGYYAHSHGDYYWHAGDQRRYTGYREDGGDCSQPVIFSKDIAAKRAGRPSNLVFMSMCHNADSNTTMPGAFAIEKVKAIADGWNGPEFFVGYIGTAFDNDEWVFEVRYWDALADGKSVGEAFDVAMLGSFTHSDFDANWWGTYRWSGFPGPLQQCTRCL